MESKYVLEAPFVNASQIDNNPSPVPDGAIEAMGAIVVTLIILTLILYVLNAIVLSKTAKANGFEKIAYMGWIPILSTYLMGYLGFKGDTEKRTKMAIIYVACLVVGYMLFIIPPIGLVLYMVGIAMNIYLTYRFFLLWGAKSNAVLFTIINLLSANILFVLYGLMHAKKPFVEKDE